MKRSAIFSLFKPTDFTPILRSRDGFLYICFELYFRCGVNWFANSRRRFGIPAVSTSLFFLWDQPPRPGATHSGPILAWDLGMRAVSHKALALALPIIGLPAYRKCNLFEQPLTRIVGHPSHHRSGGGPLLLNAVRRFRPLLATGAPTSGAPPTAELAVVQAQRPRTTRSGLLLGRGLITG